MTKSTAKTNPDHKFRLGYAGSCSCGWTGSSWYGPGARGNAAADWRSHREKCERSWNHGLHHA